MALPRAATAALAGEIQEHRIYFEVQRETAQFGDERVTVALQLWLWATVPKRAGSLPGEPGCRAALAALHAAAAAAVEGAAVTPPPEPEPFRWALYESRHVPSADEIRLELTLRPPPGRDGPDHAARERALGTLRRALSALGIFEGLWRPTLPRPPAAAPAAEPWTTRPAGDVFGWSLAAAHA